MMHPRKEKGSAWVAQAGQLALDYFQRRQSLQVDVKGLQDFVSEADRQVEQFLRQCIQAAFPEDGILGEEQGWQPGESQGYWVIDPIDGTTNFLRGLPDWCVVLAYVEQDQVQQGWIFAPVHQQHFYAQRGHGAWLNQQPLQMAAEIVPGQGLIYMGFGAKTGLSHYLQRIEYLYQQQVDQRRLGSAALCLARTAAGIVDGFYEARTQPWDVLAGLLLVEEAGGWHGGLGQAVSREPGPVLAGKTSLQPLLQQLARLEGQPPA
ncbi:inositol monophosphatase family protein [Balneatrix alpica]|uniref:Inositol-1-monophosphatase n=2 Tax=Balneatrix alpica TaxID=75684 RepID=A0ABV5ZBM5_9GAMM|nr:inositol monophosphatase [Balneatrix alpica]